MGKPKLRFRGYTDDWEQRKVSELLQERNEQAPMSEDYPLMAFIANQGVAPKGERYDRSALVNDESGKKYKRTKYGDFIYSSNNLESGSIGLNKYGNACISPVYSIFKPTGEADLDFLGRRFLRKDFINEMIKWRQGVVYGQWKIHETDFMKIQVVIPKMNEQKKMGQYFDCLDQLITLHQRKCDETKKLKKYMLQKMFPKKGMTVPEIRFDGFTDAWEQRKVGDISTITAGGTPSTKEISYWEPKEIPWLASGEVHKKYVHDTEEKISEEGLKNSSAKWVKEGSVLIALAGQGKTRGTAAITRVPITTNQSIAAIKFDDILDADYAFHNLDSRYEELRGISSGDGTRGGLNKQLLSDLAIMFPQIDEQVKIGQYFTNLDNLITLHQRKCEELQKLKKFMLQNMFV